MSIDKDAQKAPNLRFKGFTDDWEQRRLGELSNIVGGGTPSTSNPEYWDGDIDWYAPAEIGEQSYVNKSKKTITELGLKKSSARILPVGTVLFTSRAGIGNTTILAKEATTNQGFQSIVPDQNKLDSYFIFSRTNELKRYGEVTGAGSTFVEVSGKQMSKMPIMVPVLSEQQEIGTFLEQIDNTITLHQRKLDQLKQLKEALLQQMFPGKGETVPKLRFAGFEGDWEARKLGEIAPLRGGYAFESDKFTDVGIPIIRISNILSSGNVGGSFAYYKEGENDSKYTLEDKSILIAMSGATTGKISILHNENKDKYYQNQRVGYFQKTTKTDYDFIATLLKTTAFPQKLTSLLVSGAQPNVSASDIDNLNFRIPASITEQFKIGDYISKLDKIINKQNSKIESLQSMKQVLLENMFI